MKSVLSRHEELGSAAEPNKTRMYKEIKIIISLESLCVWYGANEAHVHEVDVM